MYPQLIHTLFTAVALIAALAAIGACFYLKRLFLRDFPGRTTINELRAEVASFSGEIADLTERFARFQKREGMRSARAEKETAKDLQEQAFRILAQGGDGTARDVSGSDPAEVKAALMRKMRGMQ